LGLATIGIIDTFQRGRIFSSRIERRPRARRDVMLAIAPGWELTIERGPNCLLARVEHHEAGDDAPRLADELWAQMTRHMTYQVVLELDAVGRLDSYLIGQLIQLYKRVRDHDGMLRLCGLSESDHDVLRQCQLEGLLPSYGGRCDAVMGRHSPVKPR
jgi:anti-anti-sigma factor